MHKRIISYLVVAVVSVGLTTVFQPLEHLNALAAQGTCQTFKETGKMVCGRFLQYWQQNGALQQQGYPISNEFREKSDLDGKEYTVQYFERAVFELHPENRPPYDVLLAQLGTFQFKRKYPNGEPGAPPPTPVPPPGVGVKITLQEGVTIRLDEQPSIRQACNKAQMTAKFVLDNNSALPYTYSVDEGSNRAVDSNSKVHTPGGCNPPRWEALGPGEKTMAPKTSMAGYLEFTLANMTPDTTYVDIHLGINGRALVFRHHLK